MVHAGEFLSLSGLLEGVYVQGPGPSMSILSGGLELVAWSQVIILVCSNCGLSMIKLRIGAFFILFKENTRNLLWEIKKIECRKIQITCRPIYVYTRPFHLKAINYGFIL